MHERGAIGRESLMNRGPSSWAEQQKQFYRAFPHAHLQFNPESIYAKNIVDKVLDLTGLSTARKILEVGCGPGRFTLHLVHKGLCLTALDFSEELLNHLRQVTHQVTLKPDHLVLRSGDIYKTEGLFNREEFDGIIGFFFLHHLEDIRLGLKSLSRILKKGGEVIFVEPNRLNPLFLAQIFLCKDMTWKAEKGTFRHGVSDYRQCFEDCGYTEFEIEKFGFFPPQLLDKFPMMLRIEKRLEKFPFVKILLPFLLIRAKKPLQVWA